MNAGGPLHAADTYPVIQEPNAQVFGDVHAAGPHMCRVSVPSI